MEKMRGLGPKSLSWLRDCGITTLAELKQIGAVRAYVLVKSGGVNPSLNLLWALEGAISDMDWKRVSKTHRASLLLALENYETRQGALLK